jgi:2-polyprenyl-6-methoxyphenol hydroxylase-like FAD-dependent oxidoreductase
MASVVVCGGGVIGLASALLLARDGHAVTVLEEDAHDPPPSPVQAWEHWDRKGVPQFRQPHNLFPRFQQVLDADLPDVTQRLADAGCVWRNAIASPPPTITDLEPRPGDERFRFLTGRRPVVEAVFAAAAADEPGLTVRRGVHVTGLVIDSDGLPVRVVGVRTDDGEEHRADLVVDAMGRTSPVVGWLAELGARAQVESQDRGFAYFTRYFRGTLPVQLGPALTPIESFSILTIPGDGDTWSVTVFGTSHDTKLKEVRRADRFSAVLQACPLHAHWLAGEPITEVLPMAGVLDRYRRFVLDGTPVVTGLAAVGDAWACTNPSAGRGLSVGLVHAEQLRAVLRKHDRADEAFALAWDAATQTAVAPFFRNQQRADRERIAEMEAHRDGTPVPTPDRTMARLWTAAMVDADLFRGLMSTITCLAFPEEVLAAPGTAEKLERLGADVRPPFPGPPRQELEQILAD